MTVPTGDEGQQDLWTAARLMSPRRNRFDLEGSELRRRPKSIGCAAVNMAVAEDHDFRTQPAIGIVTGD